MHWTASSVSAKLCTDQLPPLLCTNQCGSFFSECAVKAGHDQSALLSMQSSKHMQLWTRQCLCWLLNCGD